MMFLLSTFLYFNAVLFDIIDNNDGDKYKTVVLGRDLMDEAVVNSTQPSGNDSSRADDLQFEPGELAYLRASRIHMDK